MSLTQYIVLSILAISLHACETKKKAMTEKIPESKPVVQGHRGARGLMPENTIPAFIKAIDLGVNVLELDLAVSKDGQLIVSHEPYMGAHISLDSTGNEIKSENELSHNIYQMTYDQIKSYDVGSKFVSRFPDQQKMKVYKPSFSDVVDSVNAYLYARSLPPVKYNIEIKSEPHWDDLFHPLPAVFSKLVYDFIVQKMDIRQVNVQSFDFRILQYFHTHYPDVELAVLIENQLSIDENLDSLGFAPQIYSCEHILLDEAKIRYLQSKGLKVTPWTVNEEEDIKNLIQWGVDGIISDYPDRVLKIISN